MNTRAIKIVHVVDLVLWSLSNVTFILSSFFQKWTKVPILRKNRLWLVPPICGPPAKTRSLLSTICWLAMWRKIRCCMVSHRCCPFWSNMSQNPKWSTSKWSIVAGSATYTQLMHSCIMQQHPDAPIVTNIYIMHLSICVYASSHTMPAYNVPSLRFSLWVKWKKISSCTLCDCVTLFSGCHHRHHNQISLRSRQSLPPLLWK